MVRTTTSTSPKLAVDMGAPWLWGWSLPGMTLARSARVIQPPGAARLRLASTSVRSPPGSPRLETTSAASLKSSPAVKSLTVITQARPAPVAASSPFRESSTDDDGGCWHAERGEREPVDVRGRLLVRDDIAGEYGDRAGMFRPHR